MYIGYYKNDKVKILIKSDGAYITEISFVDNIEKELIRENKLIEKCKEEFDQYFNGKLKCFSIKYKVEGTKFQTIVWKELLKVNYGKTISYKQLAKNIGKPTAIRAVANAVGRNKIGIIIPCHRIIGTDGSLTGYAGGLKNKKILLELESGKKVV